jgi:surfeit locus 1 family protein
VYRFLLKPRWILSHLFVLACVVAFVNLGFWQLRRLDERRAYNSDVKAAEALPPAPLDDVLPAGAGATADDVDTVQYRAVTVSGTYRPDQQVLVRNRSYDGSPGYWVLTPLVRDDGTAVVVNRGWVPYSYSVDGPWTDFDPPTGTVSVAGMLRTPQVRASGGLVSSPKDPDTGVLRALSRVDVGRLQQQVGEPLVPAYVDLRTQDPAQDGTLPVPVPEPELSEGPHFGYAMQWFSFAILTCIVYPLLLRRHARRRLMGDPDEGSEIVELTADGRGGPPETGGGEPVGAAPPP